MTEPQLISPREVARQLGRSPRWVYDHWQELGGTRQFGGLQFFPEIVRERLEAARQASQAMVLQIQAEWGTAQRMRLSHSKRGPGRRGRRPTKFAESEDPHHVFSGG